MKEVYKLKGMSCTACAMSIERVTTKLNGVKTSNVNFATEELYIEYDAKLCSRESIQQVIKRAGFEAKLSTDDDFTAIGEISKRQKITFLISAVFSILLLYISMGHMLKAPIPNFISPSIHPFAFALTQAILALGVAILGYKFFLVGYKNLFKLSPNMDSLIAVSSTAAYIYGIYALIQIAKNNVDYVHNLYFESVAVVITLVSLGKILEARAKGKTGEAVKKLIGLQPQTAHKIVDGIEVEIAIQEICVGDVLAVKSGEKIPVDGIIIKGETSCDESLITGESMPLQKTIGNEVVGASINLTGYILIKATRIGKDTMLGQIVEFVKTAQGSKAPIAKLADTISKFFVPTIMFLALASAVAWLISGESFNFAVKIFVSVLVIACPCALGLATPAAITVAVGKGAELGILVKNGEVLQLSGKTQVVAFDKTGTLTVGSPSVLNCEILRGANKAEVLNFALSCESVSEHPLGRAIIDYATNNGAKMIEVINPKIVQGKGISAEVETNLIEIGNRSFLEQNKIEIPIESEENHYTTVYMAINGIYSAKFEIADQINSNAKVEIDELNRMGLKTVMITGDNKNVANFVASKLGITEVYSEIAPNEKAGVIESLKQSGKIVAMVGDGINDSPALSVADVGIAVGGGSDIAAKSSDIVLIKNDVKGVALAIKLSKAAMINIRENLFWAFLYNAVLVPVAMGLLHVLNGPLLNPMIGGFAMSASSICVILNALRMKNFGKKRNK